MMVVYRSINKGEEAFAAAVERECLETAWSAEQIGSLPENAVYLVAVAEETVCGIASLYCIAGEGQLMNLAVSPKFRRMGIAEGMMNRLFAEAKSRNCENITLEVAENNLSAISLYKKCGFEAVGSRRGFYGGVDALIMEKKL